MAGRLKNARDAEDFEAISIGDMSSLLNRRDCDIINPIDKGSITDWDMMQKMWEYTFDDKLKCDP